MRAFADFSNNLTDEQRITEIKAGDPRINDVDAADYMEALRRRFEEKDQLLQQGMSNQLAERYLDRKGRPRPYGWHTVFFYPGSNRMRTRYIALFAFIALLVAWVAF